MPVYELNANLVNVRPMKYGEALTIDPQIRTARNAVALVSAFFSADDVIIITTSQKESQEPKWFDAKVVNRFALAYVK